MSTKFAGPLAQGVLDPVLVPCPMSWAVLDCLFYSKIMHFLGTSADESVPPAGYSLATCWIAVAGRDPKKVAVAAAGSTFALHGRTWAPLEPSWGQLGPAWGQLGTNLSQLGTNSAGLGTNFNEYGTISVPAWSQKT